MRSELQVGKIVMSLFGPRCAIGLLLLAIVAQVAAANQTDVIGQINPPDMVGISGFAFSDLSPDHTPLVIDSRGALQWRISLADASVLQTYTTPEANASARGLAYIGGGDFYETRDEPNALFVVNPIDGTANRIGTNLGGGVFNFLDIAIDPTTDKLWAVTDQGDSGEIYEIDQGTGVAIHRTTIASGMNQAVSLAIGPTGKFYVSNQSGSAGLENSIFEVNPSTGQFTEAMQTGFAAPDFLLDFAFDDTRGIWYGVIEQRSASPRAWLLVQLNGLPVPEPSAWVIAFIAFSWLVATVRKRGQNVRTS